MGDAVDIFEVTFLKDKSNIRIAMIKSPLNISPWMVAVKFADFTMNEIGNVFSTDYFPDDVSTWRYIRSTNLKTSILVFRGLVVAKEFLNFRLEIFE